MYSILRVSGRRSFTLLCLFGVLALLIGAPVLAAPAAQGAETQSPTDPGDHLVTNITLTPDSPNILRTNVDVNLAFTYITNEPGGVRIWARPFTNGQLTPNYAAHGSPVYPTGSGQGTGSFTITNGTVEVDQIRFQIWDANQTELLFEAFLPVYYLFTDAANVVSNISLDPDNPDVLGFNQDVDLTFDYATRQVGGVRIWARPFTNGQLTPNYAAHGSPLYPIGGGSGSGSFTISSVQVVVDHIRIQMWDDNQTTLLFEAFLPVYYRFMNSTNIVTNIEFAPDTPNIFEYDEDINLTFDYTTNRPEGVRIWARPFSGPDLSPNYGAHGSPVYPTGSGNGTGSFNLSDGPIIVDRVRIQMWDPNQTALLFEAFLPVSLFWAGAGPPPGPDMQVDAIEVTQAIQDLNNSVDLVAGKRTYVRVHVSSPVNIADVYATLSGKRGTTSLVPILSPGNPGADITVLASPDRGQINDSFWFELPSSWTAAGDLTLTARLDPNGAKFDPDPSDNTRIVTVNFQSTPPLRLRLINVQYTSGGNTYLAGNSHLNALESWLRRAYPISSLQVTRQTFVYPSGGLPNVDTLHGWLALGKLFRIIFSGEDPRVVYYGIVDDGGGFMRGKALDIPSTIAAGPTGTGTWGWDTDGSYGDWYGGHEIAHTRNRFHAEFCGAGGGAAYPYTSGRISPSLSGNTAAYGFDITTRAIYGPTWKDVMTYCDNQWVSDFTYEGIRSYLVGVGRQTDTLQSVTAEDFLLVMGMADLENNTAYLQSVVQISQEATVPLPEPGDWTIALLDAGDVDLATYPFEPDELTDAEDSFGRPAVIAEAVPWSPGVVRVEIRFGGEVIASQAASANPPAVTILTPTDGSVLPDGPFNVTWDGTDPDGDDLTYNLFYSNDGGANWQVLATGLQEEEIELDTDQLPGGSGQVRVVVSDGFLSGQADSGVFDVPLHSPSVQILLPEPDQTFFPTQQVVLEGSAYDLEDGIPEDAAYEWSSSVDGILGVGALLNTSELTTGVHTITLTVTDSDAMAGMEQLSIEISEAGTLETNDLDFSPTEIFTEGAFGGPTVPYTVTVRTTGDTELDWTASENLPWLSLDQSAGTTPTELILTFDPSGLPVGVHTGVVEFSSTQAGNSPADLLVSFEVTGNAVYLPGILRMDP